MINLTINGNKEEFAEETTVLEASKTLHMNGVHI